MGHETAHAALIYQHVTTEADRNIAAALARRIEGARTPQTAAPQTVPDQGDPAS
jgi:hypothetical protein